MPSVPQNTGGADRLWVAVTGWGVGLPVQPLPKTGPGLGQTVPGAPGPSHPDLSPTPPPQPQPYLSASASPLCLSLSLPWDFSLLLFSPLLGEAFTTLPHGSVNIHTHANRLSLGLTDARQLGSAQPILWRYTVRLGLSRRPGAAWREAAAWPAVSPERAPALPCVCAGRKQAREHLSPYVVLRAFQTQTYKESVFYSVLF